MFEQTKFIMPAADPRKNKKRGSNISKDFSQTKLMFDGDLSPPI
jgi:hypothetical protein